MSASQEWPLQLIVLPDDWYQHTLVFSIGNEDWPPAESRYACHVRDLGKALDTMRQAGFKVFDPLEFAKPFVGQEGWTTKAFWGTSTASWPAGPLLPCSMACHAMTGHPGSVGSRSARASRTSASARTSVL